MANPGEVFDGIIAEAKRRVAVHTALREMAYGPPVNWMNGRYVCPEGVHKGCAHKKRCRKYLMQAAKEWAVKQKDAVNATVRVMAGDIIKLPEFQPQAKRLFQECKIVRPKAETEGEK